MKKCCFLIGMSIFFVCFSAGRLFAANTLSEEELFVSKCTKCHNAEKAKKIHGTKESFLNIIKRMQSKEGANISDKEADAIAGLLGDPNREVFETKCSKCHSLERVDQKHLTGETAQKILNTMCIKKGCDISEGERKTIEKYLKYYISRMLKNPVLGKIF
jgi:arsenate reductase-like glutaredoxin family protein